MRNILQSRMLGLFLFLGIAAMAQERSVSGKVTSADDGSSLPGVNVLVKGTSLGAVTDADGNYSLSVPANAALLFSFIGFQSQEVAVGDRTIINVSLTSDVQQLSEVVVTALGIERTKSSLGYATQQISGDNIRVAREQNINSAIAGKIAGVQIVSGSGSRFGAPAIRIRGIRGVAGGNPLYVLDGIVIDDPASVNMDNIQGINVLKGANAAALYGSRARDGVVVMTSKRGGKGDQVTIDVNQTTTFDRVYILPKYQNEYGGGYDQDFDIFSYDPNTHDAALAGLDGMPYPYFGADESWGPRMDGRMVAQWDSFTPGTTNYGKAYPWSPQPDNVRDFYRTGVLNNTSINIGKSSETYALNATLSKSTRTGVMENSNQDKLFLNVNFNAKLSKKLEVLAAANYNESYTKGNLFEGYNSIGSNFNQWFQRQLDMKSLKRHYKTPDGNYTSWNINSPTDLAPLYWDNPYAYVYGAYTENERDVLSSKFGVIYEVLPKLKASITATRNSRNDVFYNRIDDGMLFNPAFFMAITEKNVEDNIQAMLSYDKRFGEFSVVANVGMNYRKNTLDFLSTNTSGGLSIRGLYNISASNDPYIANNFIGRSKVNSYFGQASIGWKDMVYLDATFREDYDSRLPSGKNNYTYPSVSASFVFSEIADLTWLSFGKVRASYAKVGNELDWYQTTQTYGLGIPFNGNPVTAVPNNLIDPSLRAATTSSQEVGFELGFLDNRIHTEFSYYHQDNANELLNITVPSSSGGNGLLTNSIESFTRGWELSLGGTPLKNANGITWDVNFNISRNRVFIEDLGYGLESFPLANGFGGVQTIGGWGNIQALARANEEWGVIVGRKFRRDDNGNIVVGANGAPLFDINQDLGHILPDFTGGIFNRFTYKNFELAFTIDYQIGGMFHSVSRMFGAYSGLTSETVGMNDKGNPMRNPVAEGGGLTFGGVFADGTPNDIYLPVDTYWKSLFALHEAWMYDATFVKLRELRIGYNIPSRLLERTGFIKGASIALIANNPWLIHAKVDGIDPSEISGDAGTQTGISAFEALPRPRLTQARNNGAWVESGNLPGTRSFGVDVRLKF
jgi:TonB-linked SusC/RagA family outer membrane protein